MRSLVTVAAVEGRRASFAHTELPLKRPNVPGRGRGRGRRGRNLAGEAENPSGTARPDTVQHLRGDAGA